MDIFHSARLSLRTVRESDRSEIVAMFQAGSLVERWSPPLAAGSTFDQMLDRWLSDDASRHVRLVTERLDSNAGPRLANVIGLTDIVRGVFQNAFIGWRTHPDLVNQGYGTDAVRLVLRYAFADSGLKLHRVQAAILPDNAASRRLADRTGFRLEGVAERYLFIREQWRDHLIYAVTSEEFAAASR